MEPHEISNETAEDVRRGHEGFIYVVEFGTGTFKVGKTQSPKTRMGNHRSSARMMATDIKSAWLSPRHRHWSENEDRLISFCLKRFGAPVFGRETFRGSAADVVEYAESLPYTGMPLDEIAAYVSRQMKFKERLSGSSNETRVFFLMRQAEIYINLTNDGNRAAANEALYNVMLEVADRTPSPWACSDPEAAVRHVESISSDSRRIAQRAREFEKSGRVLFMLSYGRWPETFDEVVGYFKVVTGEAPADVLVCRHCSSDWGVQESDDASCLNCGFGTANPSDQPAGVVYAAPRYASGAS